MVLIGEGVLLAKILSLTLCARISLARPQQEIFAQHLKDRFSYYLIKQENQLKARLVIGDESNCEDQAKICVRTQVVFKPITKNLLQDVNTLFMITMRVFDQHLERHHHY